MFQFGKVHAYCTTVSMRSNYLNMFDNCNVSYLQIPSNRNCVTLQTSSKTFQTAPLLSAFSSLTLKTCLVPLRLRHQSPF